MKIEIHDVMKTFLNFKLNLSENLGFQLFTSLGDLIVL